LSLTLIGGLKGNAAIEEILGAATALPTKDTLSPQRVEKGSESASLLGFLTPSQERR